MDSAGNRRDDDTDRRFRHGPGRGRINPAGIFAGYGWLLLLISVTFHAALLLCLPGFNRPTPRTMHQLQVMISLQPEVASPDGTNELEQLSEDPVAMIQPETPAARLNSKPRADQNLPPKPVEVAVTASFPASPKPVIDKISDNLQVVHSSNPAGASPPEPADSGTNKQDAMPDQTLLPPVVPDRAVPESMPVPKVDLQALLADYAAVVKSQILQHKHYPRTAERLGHQGATGVSFTIMADGSLGLISVRDSAGSDSLDQAALTAVRDAAPFLPLPDAANRDSLSLTITLKYYFK